MQLKARDAVAAGLLTLVLTVLVILIVLASIKP